MVEAYQKTILHLTVEVNQMKFQIIHYLLVEADFINQTILHLLVEAYQKTILHLTVEANQIQVQNIRHQFEESVYLVVLILEHFQYFLVIILNGYFRDHLMKANYFLVCLINYVIDLTIQISLIHFQKFEVFNFNSNFKLTMN